MRFNPNKSRAILHAGSCIAAAALCIGCASESKNWKFASWDVRKAVGLKSEPEQPEPEVPSRLVATWTETVLNQAGEKPKRGFGGRIAFFKRESDDPVRVDGQLVVYAFDETSRPSHETHPTRKYIFPAEEFVRHESESALGPSYSFWLPWDEVGGPQRNISLIARFEPKGGPIVIGEQTKHFLPGLALDASRPQLAGEASDVVESVRLAAYAQQSEGAVPDLAEPLSVMAQQPTTAAEKPQMSTATIPLPPRLGAALAETQRAADDTSTYDPRVTSDLPLSQIAKMSGAEHARIEEQPAETDDRQPPDHARTPLRAIAAARAGGSRSSAGSLRDSLPVQARRSGPTVHGRAR